jgi:hypothetical protein
VRNAYSYADSDSDSNANGDGDINTDTNGHSDSYSYGHSHSYRDLHTYTYCDGHVNTDTDANVYAKLHEHDVNGSGYRSRNYVRGWQQLRRLFESCSAAVPVCLLRGDVQQRQRYIERQPAVQQYEHGVHE